MSRASNRLLEKQRFSTARRPLPLYGGKGSFLVSRTLTNTPLTPMPSHAKKPCVPSKGKSLTKASCRSELVFTRDEGLKLRLCTMKGKPGPIVPVSSPSDATRISREFCACVKRTKNAKACAVKVSRNGSLGRYGRRR